ncbi:protein lifeguard 2 isoform X5 [Odocoileus virginianus]|uniref:Protein lifeguard 2 isoform X5 n=1 Tax=Odocoileus virginianus TaxID=9874 RepID=A0A6J0Y8C2_ODOVR
MDVEVSEPIDFSSGDHQHLVRKASDSYPGGKTARSYGTAPSTEGPQQAHGNPHSKAGKRADTYVVQISPETTTDDVSPGTFSETAVRRAFIVKVFFLLSIQLLITGAIISLFVFWDALRSWVIKHPWFNYSLLPAFFVVFIILACCGKLRRQVPANYILLGLFWDFTLLNGTLFVLLFVLIIYGILLIFIRSYWLHLLYAGLGTVLFSLYLVMDVQLMVGGRHHHSNLDPEEYVFAALNIYMDIINLFLFILQLIGMGR